MLWLMTTCTVGMSRPLEAEAGQHHCPHGETEAGTHPRSSAVKLGPPNPCLKPDSLSGPSVGESLSQQVGGSTLGCSPGCHICCNQDPVNTGLELGQGGKAFFLCQVEERIGGSGRSESTLAIV